MSELLTADRLVVSQKAKLIELVNQYSVQGGEGAELGFIQQEGQSKKRKVLRFVTNVDQFLTLRLSLYDSNKNKLLEITRPAKLLKSKLRVQDGAGRVVGGIIQKNVFGKIHFDLVGSQDQILGQIKAENWRAWDFSIVDSTGKEVGRIDKKFVGVLKAAFTPADNYIVDIDPSLRGDLRLLTIAAATAVDTALKQDARVPSVTDLIPD